ncbi:hypothetical protein PYW08_008899 [Mythimna loreyi]|uniref:Uncharacterized protein n=1 Tax=Mythimna loreyi TaxID=667449 RepID=A0ACC2QCF6_9NEOP|nr:hypothetical protein PYW08_008899 [Mythimna loreyi]
MKFVVALCVFALVALSSGNPPAPPAPLYPTHSRGCQYISGRCYKECEEGTHSYSTGCGPLTPEATCEEPNPVEGKGLICDYSACHCDSPTVRDSVSGKCVKVEECPKKEE